MIIVFNICFTIVTCVLRSLASGRSKCVQIQSQNPVPKYHKTRAFLCTERSPILLYEHATKEAKTKGPFEWRRHTTIASRCRWSHHSPRTPGLIFAEVRTRQVTQEHLPDSEVRTRQVTQEHLPDSTPTNFSHERLYRQGFDSQRLVLAPRPHRIQTLYTWCSPPCDDSANTSGTPCPSQPPFGYFAPRSGCLIVPKCACPRATSSL